MSDQMQKMNPFIVINAAKEGKECNEKLVSSEKLVMCLPSTAYPVLDGMRKKQQGVKHKHVKNSDGDYMCQYCDYTTANQSTVSEHITRKHAVEAGRILNPFECIHCLERFVSKTSMLHHISNHHIIVLQTCPKVGCGYSGKSQAAVYTHYVRRHMDLSANSRAVSLTETMCLCCNKVMKPATMVYHLAKCSIVSPFYVPPPLLPMEMDYITCDAVVNTGILQ